MNEQRLKDLRNTLRPLREARAILGDELMSDEDDEELMEAFISTDYAIENIKRATGLSPREPRPFGMDAAIIDSLNTRVELGETVSAETDEFVREHGAAYFRAIRERAWEDHTAMRGPGFKGLPADQRISGLRGALKLLKNAQITILAVHQAEEAILERTPGTEIEGNEATICKLCSPICSANEELAEAIETVRMMTWLPGDPWMARSR
jgi:hypothetical protein